MSADALRLEGVEIAYRVRGRELPVLHDVSFAVRRGEAYGLVGESGCGKSTAALAAIGALPRNGRVRAGRIAAGGQVLAELDAAALRRLRSHTLSMVYQDPGRALNPALTIGRQVAETYELLGRSHATALTESEAMLARVQIAGSARVMASYPHQLSGGMQQRVVIAMALAKNPALLILDEPTTGLDATVEAVVLDLIAHLRAELGTAILLISHNLALVGRMCERVGVLYAGSLVEEGPAEAVLADPRHPYTAGLLRCLPRGGRGATLETIPGTLPPPGSIPTACIYSPRCPLADAVCGAAPPPSDLGGRITRCHHHDRVPAMPRATATDGRTAPARATASPMLEVSDLSKTYTVAGRALPALRDVSLSLGAGETLGLVGKSGSGKTTLARVLLGLTPPDAGGRIVLDGAALAPRARGRAAAQIKALQIVFQNPDSALNRSHTVRRLIGRPLRRLGGYRGAARHARLLALVRSVRLPERFLPARPVQLSGGLKQRVAIARAFAGDPRVVICDEPTSSLDVSVQAAILNLLAELQAKAGVSYVFISHDLAVVRHLSDRVAVLYLGRLMQVGPAASVFGGARHPYTEALLSAAGAGGIRLAGEPPSPQSPPSGCVFHTRCPRKLGAVCETEEPALEEADGNAIRCHIPRRELEARELAS